MSPSDRVLPDASQSQLVPTPRVRGQLAPKPGPLGTCGPRIGPEDEAKASEAPYGPDEDDRSRFALALAVSPAWLLAEGNPRLRRLGPFLEESETLPDLFHAPAALLRLPLQRGKQLARAGRPPGLALCAEEFPARGARTRAGIAAPTPPGRLRLPPLSARAGAGAAGVLACPRAHPG